MFTMYGIPNCDSVKKAKKFLQDSGVEFSFVDFKKSAPSSAQVKSWSKQLGEVPVNMRGTTFRKIKEEYLQASEAAKIKMLVENSSAIKRPILEKEGQIVAVGHKDVLQLTDELGV